MPVKNIATLVIFLSICQLFTINAYCIEPKEFVQKTVDSAGQALDSSLNEESKIVKLKAIAKKTVDIEGIGLYSLGKHRKKISNEQRERYLEIFKKYFLISFSSFPPA